VTYAAKRLLRRKSAVLGLGLVAAFGLVALLVPFLPLEAPNEIDTANRLRPPLTPGHLLGTDEFGRDILSRLAWGSRPSLAAGVTSALLSMGVGVPLGLMAGYLRGPADHLLMRAIDIVMAFPYILLAIALVAAFGPGIRNATLALAIVGIPLYARLTRSTVLSIRELEYVDAARALGLWDVSIMWRHVLPNALPPVIVATTLDIGFKIVATAGLSFLGLGVQPPTADWGSMLASGRNFVGLASHVATLPGLAILLVTLGFNLFGDGLRDTLDPTMRSW
jgi:peptide/nickel transport system permease protein